MSLFVKIATVGVVLLAILQVINKMGHPLPKMEDEWWGEGEKEYENGTVKPMIINISSNVIDDLYRRLEQTKPFHPSYKNVGQSYGISNTALDKIIDHWKTKYDWATRQQIMNRYPHYHVQIRGLKIHFIHVKPNRIDSDVTVVPLLMLHGWPSSFLEFWKVIPYLIIPQEDKDIVFELVIPSLPGFGFSDYPKKPGMSSVYIAQVFADLMKILGFPQYYVHGGDWGSSIGIHMSQRYPESVLGFHSTMCFTTSITSFLKLAVGKLVPRLIYEKGEKELCDSIANSADFLIEETGYFHIQATKPDTIGVALRDSPVGLAAYMLEKFGTLTNTTFRDRDDGGLLEKFSADQLLDNIMLYWVTESMTSAMRIYAEAFTNFELEFKTFRLTNVYVPTGCARFRYEILLSPRSILRDKYKNLVHLTSYNSGGHFAAMEEPKLFAYDIIEFVEKVEFK